VQREVTSEDVPDSIFCPPDYVRVNFRNGNEVCPSQCECLADRLLLHELNVSIIFSVLGAVFWVQCEPHVVAGFEESFFR
jgi:hypothetical protein